MKLSLLSHFPYFRSRAFFILAADMPSQTSNYLREHKTSNRFSLIIFTMATPSNRTGVYGDDFANIDQKLDYLKALLPAQPFLSLPNCGVCRLMKL
jgi:hypothetical protein